MRRKLTVKKTSLATSILGLVLTAGATDYYLDSATGDDAADGRGERTAWKSIGRMSEAKLAAGDRVLFRRGGVWRGNFKLANGEKDKPVYYGPYGEGPRPILLGSVSKADPADWMPVTNGIWATAPVDGKVAYGGDVGNVVFDEGVATGWKRWSLDDLERDYDYFYDESDGRVYLRLDRNPATVHSSIELGRRAFVIDHGARHAVVESLSIRHSGGFAFGGVGATDVTVRDCEMIWIGGAKQGVNPTRPWPVRYGNGIEYWHSAADCLVEGCYFDQIYDAALTAQAGANDKSAFRNIVFRDNVIRRAEYSYELWHHGAEGRMENIVFEHNTCLDAGRGWGHRERPDPNGCHLLFSEHLASSTNLIIRNNVFCRAEDESIMYRRRDLEGLDLNHNLYWNDNDAKLRVFCTKGMGLYTTYWRTWETGLGRRPLVHESSAEGLVEYRKATGYEEGSRYAYARPRFRDPLHGDWRLAGDSPGNALSSAGGPAGVRSVPREPFGGRPSLDRMAVTVIPAPRKMTVRPGYCVEDEIREETDASLPAEGYRLSVAPDGIRIVASDAAGRFYARETLRQLKTAEDGYPCVEIEDAPAYGWRGVHFDDCRHFFGMQTLKKTLDLMARYKFNVLMWHLSDDQGWRVEIPRYPELVATGSVRSQSPRHGSKWHKRADGTSGHEMDGLRYGPFFYTQEQVKEVVAYAAARHIRVVPFIDTPGHMAAAVAACPELTCFPERVRGRGPRCFWGMSEDVLCLGNEQALEFVENVFDDICRLFPFGYVMVGGDECPMTNWKECTRCRALMAREGMEDATGLLPWFTSRIVRFLEARGKRVIGFDEMLSCGGIPKSTVGLVWRASKNDGGNLFKVKTPAECTAEGFDIINILAPNTYFYYGQGLREDPFLYGDSGPIDCYGGGSLTLKKTYSFDPSLGVAPEHRHHVMGGQCCNWSEYTWNEYDLQWKMWPRGCAMAETLWCGDDKPGFDDFKRRAASHRRMLIREGVNCASLE